MSHKNTSIFDFNMQNPNAISHEIVNKIFKIWQSYSPVLLILSISVPNLVSIGRHLTLFVMCAKFNM